MTQQAIIKIESTLDGEKLYNEYSGGYVFKNNAHNIAYTDLSGNAVTKTAIEANEEKMLLHRVGAFNGDMLFDRLTDTVTRYDAFSLTQGFLVHTYEYNVETNNSDVVISLKYGLIDGKNENEIVATQKITVNLGEKS